MHRLGIFHGLLKKGLLITFSISVQQTPLNVDQANFNLCRVRLQALNLYCTLNSILQMPNPPAGGAVSSFTFIKEHHSTA